MATVADRNGNLSDEETGQDIAEAAEEWQTVSEDEVDETKIVFDTIGDEFIGIYAGPRVIENEDGKFTQYRFTVGDEHYFTNAGYSLMRGMSNVPKGSRVRIVFSSERDTQQDSPMKVFTVQVAKARKGARR
jgi:hypothetical protein